MSDNSLRIQGKVNRSAKSGSIHGHIDIAIFDSNGKNIKQLSVKQTRPFWGRGYRHSSTFNADLNFTLPKGSIIKVASHKINYSNSFDCLNNKAAEGK